MVNSPSERTSPTVVRGLGARGWWSCQSAILTSSRMIGPVTLWVWLGRSLPSAATSTRSQPPRVILNSKWLPGASSWRISKRPSGIRRSA
ncbi:hypothetical protein D3C86_989450 [compost metagenome]